MISKNLEQIKNGEYNVLRKNDASRWVANDIIRKGNQYSNYDKLPENANQWHRSDITNPRNFAKIPAEI